MADLVRGSSLGGRLEELRGRSVLVATGDQLTAALALIELDGMAGRLILCPPDLPPGHLPSVMATGAVDAVVSDGAAVDAGAPRVGSFIACSPRLVPAEPVRNGRHQTEWILLTSGTTGLPKLVVHTLSSLAGAIRTDRALAAPAVWSTFYDIRRYGGLQILLRALLGGGSMVLWSAGESTAEFLVRAGARGVTHISGTPSHWRRALMSPAAHKIAPRYVRLSGEIADQAILDHLRSFYPEASIAHAFASTEAGLAFDVGDGLAGFPVSLIGRGRADTEMRVEEDSLRIRSGRTALRYLGNPGPPLADGEGFVDTGDIVERRGDRYHFVGRRGGIINVGGLKVHPEEVEAVINGHSKVRMSLVRGRPSPITGELVVADVVLRTELESTNGQAGELQRELLQFCREWLPRHKVPAAINFVPALAVAATGKMVRHHA
ncbi:MAG TPA: fatty acid--CoA ligase family protein [Methylomirabilota bacterium]|nr:fatty acid--CoA ligase family protein [Methylomirabilota bacterium]